MSKPRIVVVDDHAEFLEVIVEFLTASDYEVCDFNEITSVSQIAVLSPNLVILDLEMPGLTGSDILKQIRQTDALKSLPVIIITGLKERADKDTLRLSQAMLEKPFSLHDLHKQINSLLQN